jgi:hypothetical protein
MIRLPKNGEYVIILHSRRIVCVQKQHVGYVFRDKTEYGTRSGWLNHSPLTALLFNAKEWK